MNTINAIIDEGGGTASQKVNSISNNGTDWLSRRIKKTQAFKIIIFHFQVEMRKLRSWYL